MKKNLAKKITLSILAGAMLLSSSIGAAAFDFQAVMEDFEENIAILRKNFYKEEYLK